ncbi:MAG: TIGR01440 family protein [Clostridiales bacterium]|nr:TIGR01440 family protein [Clostridiales bacterium]
MDNLYEISKKVAGELIEKAKLKKGQIVVIGCSTSEVVGDPIGTNSNPQAAEELFRGFKEVFDLHGIYMAAQCCEHLNRAIVTVKEAVPGKDIVNVIPQSKAGGSFATLAYQEFTNPVVVEDIKADAGLDIGGTLIGMHLKKVAVPLKLSINHIGNAFLIAARTRSKFIGGERAIYDERLM